MDKEIMYGLDACLKVKKGIDAVADAVKITLGPKGRNVLLKRNGQTVIVNDGGTIAHEIQFKDDLINMGADIIKGVIKKTTDTVGGGRTASAVLTQEIISSGTSLLEKGLNMNLVKKGMNQAVEDITNSLKEMAIPIESLEELTNVAIISTESDVLGKTIAEVIHTVGRNGFVTVEDSHTLGVTTSYVEGLQLDRGYVSAYMVTDPERMDAVLKDTEVLVTDKSISQSDIVPLLTELLASEKRSLLIIADDFDKDVIPFFVVNSMKGAFRVLAVKAPGFGPQKESWLRDISVSTGATLVSDSIGSKFEIANLGHVKKVVSTKDKTTLYEGSESELTSHIETLTSQLAELNPGYEKSQLETRIARLSSKIATIHVGTSSDIETINTRLKIEDGVHETKNALEEGIVPGGNVAYLHATKNLKMRDSDSAEDLGYNIIWSAVLAPLKQIIANGGYESLDTLLELSRSESDLAGYDVNTNTVVPDIVSLGIVDAVKVTRTIIENAVSAAALFLTMGAVVYTPNEKEETYEATR